MEDIIFRNRVKEIVDARVKEQVQFGMFTTRKLTDTPSDDLQIVNRRFVTLNGTVRPISSIVGQQFFDTTLASGRGKPIYWNGTGWVDATGTYV